eukprot:4856389-Amphidinium_carterae.1
MHKTVSSMHASAKESLAGSRPCCRRRTSMSLKADSSTIEKASALRGSPCCRPLALVILCLCWPGICMYPVASRASQALEHAASDSSHCISASSTDALWTMPKAFEMSVWRKRWFGLATASSATFLANFEIPLGVPIPCWRWPKNFAADSWCVATIMLDCSFLHTEGTEIGRMSFLLFLFNAST